MKKILNFVFYPLIGLLAINFFFLNSSLANGLKAYDELKAGNAIFLDIREKDEIKTGIIKGASWLPLSNLNSNPIETIQKLKNLLKDKGLYIYCRSGKRAEAFIGQIKDHGIKGKNLGGYDDLISLGLPSEIP